MKTDSSFKTPVCLIIFNRPEMVEQVMGIVRRVRPAKLFIVADGPRESSLDDKQKCSEARLIAETVDWDCQIYKNYSDFNMGVGRRPATGISWVFEHVEKAIILEDDCVPDISFFRFCEELLELYEMDERIFMITGTNFLGEWKEKSYSYHFSYFPDPCWGWASWRRAWSHYDYHLQLWNDKNVKSVIRKFLSNNHIFKIYGEIFDTIAAKQDYNVAWDFQWAFSRWYRSGLSVVPSVNLVKYIGFGQEATNTFKKWDFFSNEAHEILFPLNSSKLIAADRTYDKLFYNLRFRKGIRATVKNWLYKS